MLSRQVSSDRSLVVFGYYMFTDIYNFMGTKFMVKLILNISVIRNLSAMGVYTCDGNALE